jgi:dihydroorotate dehydrogenase (NAD+) catalytic subunit
MYKHDLTFRTPLMNAAGTLGFASDTRIPLNWEEFGAFVTNPLSLRPRKPAVEPALVEYPGGFLLHSGLPNSGLSAALKKHAPRWARSDIPTIVHLMADRPDETSSMVRMLEGVENVVAAELGFAPLLADDIVLVALEMSLGELPLIVNLPFEQVLTLGPRCMDAGAAAVSLAAPRGMLPPLSSLHFERTSAQNGGIEGGGRQVTGRLFGPALFAQSLLVVNNAVRAGIPVIGGCGVYSKENASAMLAAGALAVQVDTVLWRGDFQPTIKL